jgi:hypothetical protein
MEDVCGEFFKQLEVYAEDKAVGTGHRSVERGSWWSQIWLCLLKMEKGLVIRFGWVSLI